MLPEALKTYLSACKDQGLAFDTLVPQLVSSGYSSEVVELARSWFDQSPAAASPAPAAASPGIPAPVRRRPKALFAALGIGLFVFLLSGLSASAYLIAADKIPFPNAGLKNTISKIVFSIPFVPKTPKFVLAGVPAAHAKVSRSTFDISMAVDTGQSAGLAMLGLGSLDVSLTGFTDITDPKNPRFTMTANAFRDFEVQMRKPDTNLYLKVDKIPVALTAMMGIEPDIINQLMANWLVIDTSALQTEARKNLDELLTETDENITQTEAEARAMALLTRITEEDIAPDLQMVKEDLDGHPVYKISYQPTPDDLKAIASKILLEYSEEVDSNDPQQIMEFVTSIKNPTLVMYVDRSESYLRRLDLTFTIEPPVADDLSPSTLSELPLAFEPPARATFATVIKWSNFGQDQAIDVPSPALTPEEFLQLYYDTAGPSMSPLGLNPASQLSQARDAKRRADLQAIKTAVTLYQVEHPNTAIPGLTSSPRMIAKATVDLCDILVPEYIVTIPVDPGTNISAVSDCSQNYSTGYYAQLGPGGEVVFTAPFTESGQTVSTDR